MLTLSFFASLPQLDWGAVLPVAERGAQPPLSVSFMRGTFVPFLESFFAVMVLVPLYNRPSGTVRPIFAAALFAGAFLALTLMKNTMLLGFPAVSQYFFPSYTAASVVTVGDFFERQELLGGRALPAVRAGEGRALPHLCRTGAARARTPRGGAGAVHRGIGPDAVGPGRYG